MAVRIKGIEELRAVARTLKAVAEDKETTKTLKAELTRNFNKAVKPLKEDIEKFAPVFLPDQYALLLKRKIRITVSRRGAAGSGAHLHLKIAGRGRKEKRDIDRIDRGVLRHPVYGRYTFRRRGGSTVRTENPWVAQPVRPGFVTDRVRALTPKLIEACHDAITSISHEVDKA